MTCPACGRAVEAAARYCQDCGAGLGSSEPSATRTLHAAAGSPTPSSARGGRASAVSSAAAHPARYSSTSSDSLDHGRFVPGALVLDRYRVLGLLGRGGMGEVYRADDLRLGQPVALKFLPPDLAREPSRLARFHAEVRLARQVSHPNVCRVYDIGEVDGQVFLSMEYIDGEDLATLLRRIGRLPNDKAVEIARQLCAGLAAAHDRGVLHRDLKPSNVMIDGRGRTRITDFGLAGVVGAVEGEGSRAGTPAYMAPEQLASGEASVRTDVFALGLVLYELFTGKRAFQGETFADLMRNRQEKAPTSPSTLVEGFDPAVERVILRCLENDPRQRPPSALAVAAALPGGDPLAMALAAGETPSPEMVAAAGEVGGLRPLLVWVCLGAVLACVLGVVRLAERTTLLGRAAPPKTAEVLLDRAQEIVRQVGYAERPAGIAYGFGYHRSYLEHIQQTDPSAERWDRLEKPQPPALFFWYRQSPVHLEAGNHAGVVTTDDPPPLRPGMVQVQITSRGDLWRFEAVPPQVDDAGPTTAEVDWGPLIAEAGLRREDLVPVEPRWVPSTYADARSAWEAHYPGEPKFPVRVEAASYRGRPVSFQIYWPWNRPLRAQPFEPSPGERIADVLIRVLVVAALIGGLLLARRNVRLGRIDRRGAYRLAGVVFTASMIDGLCVATHVPTANGEWFLFMRLCGRALYEGLVVWLYYMALEPTVRRRWPDLIISWTRLLAGRIRDPLVGRDVLMGIAAGAFVSLLAYLTGILPEWIGRPPTMPGLMDFDLLTSPRIWVAFLMARFIDILNLSLVSLFLLLLMRILLRRPWAAATALIAIGTAILTLGSWQDLGLLGLLFGAGAATPLAFLAIRFGVLAFAASSLTIVLLILFPVPTSVASSHGAPGLFAMVVLAALVLFAARAALAGRSLFEMRLPQE